MKKQLSFLSFMVTVLAVVGVGYASAQLTQKTTRGMASKGQLLAEVAPKNTLTLSQAMEPTIERKDASTPHAETKEAAQQDLADKPSNSTIKSDEQVQVEVVEKVDEPEIIFNFENADLQNLLTYIEQIFDVTFIPDDAINPMAQGGKAVNGNKISFKTHKPLTKPEAWSYFTTFLNMAGLSLYQDGAAPKVYRVTSIDNAKKSPIPAFIGVDAETLPDTDTKIRYVYFVEFTTLDTLKGIIESLRSSTSSVVFMQELKAFMLTDSAYNIKMLMRIIKELDRIVMPQSMSVLKLKQVDAKRVEELYKSLIQPDQQAGATGRIIGPRKSSGANYFPDDVRIIAEPRTNSLILLGSRDAIRQVENFVIRDIDVEPTTPYSPLHVFPLRYADAETVAATMNTVTKFGQNIPAAQVGGVRGDDKYFRPMSFTAEPTNNRVIVRGDYDDFLKAKEIMEKLDEPQPQVAIEMLILTLGDINTKELGAQIRSKTPGGVSGLLGNNIKFQTSGLRAGSSQQGIITNNSATTGAQRILGDLINLVIGKGAGNTILSLGTDQFGVWGIFQVLQSISNTQVVSNPFLVTANKTPASISLGETRRIVTAEVISTSRTQTKKDIDANLTIQITPQINSDGMIIFALEISIEEFRSASPEDGSRTIKTIKTSTIVADREILALGGLIRNRTASDESKFPILGDIPLIGWLFKNKKREDSKENLLVLISTRIIQPLNRKQAETFTKTHIDEYHADIQDIKSAINDRDLVDRTFFKEKVGSPSAIVDYHIFKGTPFADLQQEETLVKKKRRRKKKKVATQGTATNSTEQRTC